MSIETALLALVPSAIVLGFVIHWITIAKIKSAEERLPLCRGAYLGMSFQVLAFSLVIALVGGGTAPALVAVGVGFSFIGDFFNLQFGPVKRKLGEPVFFGILSFAPAQACYIAAFLSLAPWETLVSRGFLYPLLAAFIVVPAAVFRLRVYNPARPRRIMIGAFLYGFVLSAMTAIAISSAIALGGAWIAVAAGALLFLASDAVMGETTIHGRHPAFENQVPWVTYLAAQGCIVAGIAALPA